MTPQPGPNEIDGLLRQLIVPILSLLLLSSLMYFTALYMKWDTLKKNKQDTPEALKELSKKGKWVFIFTLVVALLNIVSMLCL